jgi:hypothetical protein
MRIDADGLTNRPGCRYRSLSGAHLRAAPTASPARDAPSYLLTWSASGCGSTPGTMALDPGESILIEFFSENVEDITITWSEAGVVSLAFERWDGVPVAGRQPAEPSISLVGPLRTIRISALQGASARYLTGLSYTACP